MIQGRDDVHISNINSPKQVVLGGNTAAIKNLGNRLKEAGYRSTLLRVSMAFHSPIMRVIHDELEAYVASIQFQPPQIPVISNTTMAPYPSDPGEIRRILMAHLESTVYWMNNVQTLWNDYGARVFVEVGPGYTLSNLITDTLPESTCIQTCLPSAEGLTYKTALAQLFVQGHLKVHEEPRFVSLSASRKRPSFGKPVSVPLDPTTATMGKTSSATGEALDQQDLTERLIRIIMDATGFNRDEIQPDMDLRKDLSIRSSRLPIIMDAAERQFGITIELEDFIQVRTVKDIAQQIAEVISRQQGTGLQPATKAVDHGSVRDGILKPSEDGASLKRLVFSLVPMALPAAVPMELSPGESVLLLSPGSNDEIAGDAGDILRRDYGVDTIPLRFTQGKLGPGKEGRDILTDEGSVKVSERISGMASLAGMVITVPRNAGKVTRHGGCVAASPGVRLTPQGISRIAG
jgi:acyl carrier protein